MQDLMYTNEFLKNLEKIINSKNFENHDLLKEIKETLQTISQDKSEKNKLENIKTKENKDIFQEKIETKKQKYSLFWTQKEETKVIVCLIKNK